MAEALRNAGLVAALGAEDAGSVDPPAYRPEWSPGAGVRNGPAIAAYTRDVSDHVGELLVEDAYVVLLGGDCSILLGPMLALRRLGRFGLIFADGHLDFRHPGNAMDVGAAAGEDLALVTGRGDQSLVDPDGLSPLVRDADVVAFAFREGARAARALDILETDIKLLDLEQVRRLGVEAAAATAVQHLVKSGVDGIWLHVDVDVIDSALMPAVDSPQPGGLLYEELVRLLQIVHAVPLAVGVDLTIFDPDLDEDGRLARQLSAAISDGLAV
jgi:arginase